MKKFFAYEFKRLLLPLCIFTAIATVLFAVCALTTDFISFRLFPIDEFGEAFDRIEYPVNSLLFIPAAILCVLCTAVPVMQYSYRMKKRSVDLWYSLPIKRETLLFGRTAAGLALVFIPYAVSYWVGFTIIACSENLFRLSYYVPLFFASVPLGVLLFGVNAFLYTRANTVGDGILFMLVGAFLLAMPFLYLSLNFQTDLPSALTNPTNYITFGPLCWLFAGFDSAICGNAVSIQNPAVLYTLAAAEGVLAYFGLFFTAKEHRAENAGLLSDSFFGYRVLIPAYLFFGACCATGGGAFQASAAVVLVLLLIAGLVAFFAYRRSFRLKLADILSIALPLAAGAAVAAITAAVL